MHNDPAPASTARRQLLRLAAASAGTLWLARSAWSQPRFADNPFALGVASGAPEAASVVLWTRLMAPQRLTQPVTVRWELAHDDAFQRIAQRGQAQALPELAHAVHVEVPQLAPDRWYFYRFMVGGAGQDWVSPTGRTRTAAQADAAVRHLRLAYASCQRWEHGHYSAYRHMRADAPDLVMFLGDYIYEYPNASQAVRVPAGGWVTTLDGYRQRYATYKADPDLQAMHAACPWLVTWDDHEVQNDYAGQTPGNGGPAVTDFAARRAAAYQAFYEHMPLRASALTRALQGLATGAEMRVYSQLRWGQLAGLYLLDARQYKDPQVCTQGGSLGSGHVDPAQCPAWHDPARSLLGAAQEAWLGRALAQGQPGWQVLGQQSLFGQRDTRPGPGQYFWNDGWDGYAAARQRLTDMLQKHKVPNTVMLGGDVHENWVGHIKADYNRPGSAALGVEFCGTSITSRASGDHSKLPQRLVDNPHFVFADAQHRGYGLAEFTPKELTTSLRVVDDVTRQDAAVSTLARFAVPAGRAVVERA